MEQMTFSMKKIIIGMWVIACAVLLGGNVYYTYQASKEVGLCYHLAYANLRDGYMDEGDVEYVKRYVKRQRNFVNAMYPVRSYECLKLMRQILQRERQEAIDREMQATADNGSYCALEVSK